MYSPKVHIGKTKFGKASGKMIVGMAISDGSILKEVIELVSRKMAGGMEESRSTMLMESWLRKEK